MPNIAAFLKTNKQISAPVTQRDAAMDELLKQLARLG